MSTLSLLFSSLQFPDVLPHSWEFCSVQIRVFAVTLRPVRSGLIPCLLLPDSPHQPPSVLERLERPLPLGSPAHLSLPLRRSSLSFLLSLLICQVSSQRDLLRRFSELSCTPTTTMPPILLHDRAPHCPLLSMRLCHICLLITCGISSSPAGMSATSGQRSLWRCPLLCPSDWDSPETLGHMRERGGKGQKELAAKHPRPEDALARGWLMASPELLWEASLPSYSLLKHLGSH